MLWPLDPGFGAAVWQRVPASRPALTTSFPSRSLARIRTLYITPMRRGRLPACPCRHVRVEGLERLSGRTASPQRDHPIEHLVAGHGANPRSWTEVRLGARAHAIRQRAHAPPDSQRKLLTNNNNPKRRLDTRRQDK
jgi:hypothetical protein